MNLDKIILVLRNNLINLNNEELVLKCLNENPLIKKIAIQELVNRNPIDINMPDALIMKVINNMDIEQIWTLAIFNIDTKLCRLAYQKLCSILEYYDKIYIQDDVKNKLKVL